MTQMRKLADEQEKIDNLMKTKVEKKRIRRALDVDVISSKTIEALLKYLGLETDEHMYLLDNKLNKKRIEIQGQKPNKIKKAQKPSSKTWIFNLQNLIL